MLWINKKRRSSTFSEGATWWPNIQRYIRVSCSCCSQSSNLREQNKTHFLGTIEKPNINEFYIIISLAARSTRLAYRCCPSQQARTGTRSRPRCKATVGRTCRNCTRSWRARRTSTVRSRSSRRTRTSSARSRSRSWPRSWRAHARWSSAWVSAFAAARNWLTNSFTILLRAAPVPDSFTGARPQGPHAWKYELAKNYLVFCFCA